MTYRMTAWDVIHYATRAWMMQHTEYLVFYHEKIGFSAQKAEKTRDFEKNQYLKYGKNSLNTLAPRILSL